MTQTQSIVQRARRQAIALGWHHPFFAIPGAKVRLREDKTGARTKTACVTADGVVYFHTPWCSKLSNEQLRGLIAHELMHLLMLHYSRRGSRIHKPWNIAGDMTINYALQASGIELPADGVFPPEDWEPWHAERIYDELVQKSQDDDDEGDGDPQPGQGCGVEASSGEDEGEGEAGKAATPGKSDAELARQWREVAAQATEMGRTQGKGKDDALVGALEIPQPRVKWSSILRRGMASAISAHGRDTQTYMRRGRRSQPTGPQFAGWQTNAASCAVVIDTSGSMSDEDLAQCVAETASIARQSGVALYLVTHDDGVQWSGWLARNCRPAAIQRTLTGRGGTDATEAYADVAGAARRFDAFIHFTDGFLHWPTWPANTRQRIIALTGYHVEGGSVPSGAQVVEVNTTNN